MNDEKMEKRNRIRKARREELDRRRARKKRYADTKMPMPVKTYRARALRRGNRKGTRRGGRRE